MTREQLDIALIYREEIDRYTADIDNLQSFRAILVKRSSDFSSGLRLDLPLHLSTESINQFIEFTSTRSIQVLELLISFVRNEKDVAESALTALLKS